MNYEPSSLKQLAKAIHEEVFRLFFDYKTAVFLCGAGKDVEGSIRKSIQKELQDWRLFYRYDLVFPEDLFDELLYGENHQDLLTLEEILADSVDAIVLIVESYGAVAELGVFASSETLRKKLVCVVNKKYKKSKSFINYGPLRLLKDKKEGIIIFGDFNRIPNMIKPIRNGISRVRKYSKKSAEVSNVLQAHHFILPCIFLLEPVPQRMLVDLVRFASDIPKYKSVAITSGAISMLRKRREVTLTTEGYRLTGIGREKFSALGSKGSRGQKAFKATALDHLRLDVMTWKLRNKPLAVGGN